MHGIRKTNRLKTAEEIEENGRKLQVYQQIMMKIQQLRSANVHDHETLQATAEMLRLNPDFQMLWNYRRETLNQLIERDSEESSPVLFQQELNLTKEALMRNPKSYPTWFHRQWVIDHNQSDYQHEILLCDHLLNLDERNFHCWNYRRHVTKLAGISRQDELAYSATKINQNFSNYSAFHHRSMFLGQRLYLEKPQQWQSEVEMVQQAVFTEPDDQSAWFYYRWLISMLQVAENAQENASSALEEVQAQIQWVEELVEMEDNQAKWPMTMLLYLYSYLRACQDATDVDEALIEAKLTQYASALAQLDPDHKNFYQQISTLL